MNDHDMSLARGVVFQLLNERLYSSTRNYDRDDLFQAAYVGVLEARAKYDAKLNPSFRSYASWLIKVRVYDFVRTASGATRNHGTFPPVDMLSEWGFKAIRDKGAPGTRMVDTAIDAETYMGVLGSDERRVVRERIWEGKRFGEHPGLKMYTARMLWRGALNKMRRVA